MMLTWVLVGVGILLLIVWLRSQARKPEAGEPRPEDSALTILRERFARGEISQEEFDDMRRAIR